MEVTNRNFTDMVFKDFKVVFHDIQAAIEQSSFIAIDAEFTGLPLQEILCPYDSIENRYKQIQKDGMQFLLIQFGLCIFQIDDSKHKCTCQPYNFYIFPKAPQNKKLGVRFLFESDCLRFLVNQEFDFNKLFKYGIPYLTKFETEKLLDTAKEFERNVRFLELDSNIPVPENHREFIEKQCKEIEKFLESENETLELDQCGGFARKLLYQVAQERFKNIFMETKSNENGNWVIFVTKGSEEKIWNLKEQQIKAKYEEIDDLIGFSKVIHLLSQYKKPIVGHNMLYDLCHIIHHFIEPLPAQYKQFKKLAHSLFPIILDTKVIAHSKHFSSKMKDTSLLNVLKFFLEPPFKIPIIDVLGASYNLTEVKLHEAAYDAYLTGICLLSMMLHLGSLKMPTTWCISPISLEMQPYMNKIFVTQIADVSILNLIEEDITPSRHHVFYVTFPQEWKTNDIMKLFIPFGGGSVSYCSNTSAFVSLHKKEEADNFFKTVPKDLNFQVIRYDEFQKNLNEDMSSQPKRKYDITS